MDEGGHVGMPTQPYLDMTIEELQKQYSPSKWVKRDISPDECVALHVSRLKESSQLATSSVPFLSGVSYGDTEKQKLDMTNMESLPKDCPILVYIHGGYWQMLGREVSTFMTLPVHQAGGAVVAVGYDLAPEVSFSELVSQVKKAVRHVLELAKYRGSRGLYLCGHSAGGHLAATMLAVDWGSEMRTPSSLIKGALLVSGVFDMRPLVNTTQNTALKLDDDAAWTFSPFKQIADVKKYARNAEIVVAVGAHDSPEFIRQSKEYYEMLASQGIQCDYLQLEGEDHFTLTEKLTDPDYILTKKLLSLMKLPGR